ncbi:hypothetical protein CDV31_005941 [Fusarium ambrosium]|uniref:Zn(2)-C6 fungal-type domain-containing protein n=1 Tax=Fusarium ambrosium TaxID=131363 RepID=A0A428UG23_9HYPO|nr:hypothetical protein CDV31_005941 [Fusarium ambrosium]
MAMNYRPIKPAPLMDGSHRVDKSTRSAPKRPPPTKTACWGCRKRKAKCDGQRPACANCIKSTRECVYDTKMNDSNTRALQLANQELREQLDASNLLLRQLASGAPEVRGPILDFLAGNKQPQEIIRALRIDHSLGLRPKSTERRQGPSLSAFLRVHSNFGNSFGNLPLSSSIRANNYPPDVQDAQLRNFTVPIWAVTTLNTLPDPGGLREAFTSVYNEATRLLQEGASLEKVVGTHPEIAALFDQEEFDKSTILSKWAAQMVHSVKLKGYDFTCFASVYIFWYLMRWMISPSPETYAAMPEWIRPTPNQLFIPHINMVDFAIWPAFRELVVQLPSMQEHMEWLIDLSNSIQCEWPYELDQALYKDETSGSIDLVDLAK